MKTQKSIYVFADWEKLKSPTLLGTLLASPARGKEIFSFEYNPAWLSSRHAQTIDPNLALVSGPQYPKPDLPNFGLFLDSSPDRWGRTLMDRREAQQARTEKREARSLLELDYLLGVFDGHRMGALRFKLETDGPFLNDDQKIASPPWALLRDLEQASRQLEQDDAENNQEYMMWLTLLIAPGGSLGGARPKASVVDENNALWIAKFPSRRDDLNVGAWEFIVHQLAANAKIEIAPAQLKRFSGEHDTFLIQRFDRHLGRRIHFASAMTLLEKREGAGADDGTSYLELVEFLLQHGAQVEKDLEQLWRRIVFSICVSNVDDHLRNHGFLLARDGWILSPAYDLNPSETGDGLKLNISENDNAQNLDLAREVAPLFRLNDARAEEIIEEVVTAVRPWEKIAKKYVPTKEIMRMRRAFRVVGS